MARVAEDVHHPVQTAIEINEGTRPERAQIEARQVQEFSGFRIRVEIDLKAAIQPEAIDHVGPHAPAHVVAGFEDQRLRSGFSQPDGTGEAGQSAADDEHPFLRRHRCRLFSRRPISSRRMGIASMRVNQLASLSVSRWRDFS